MKFIDLKKTKGKLIFKHFVLKDETSIKRFVSDMLKFEDSDGNSYLPKEAFTNADIVGEAIDSLIGMRIYAQISNTEKDGNVSQWINFVSWKRASDLSLHRQHLTQAILRQFYES